MRRLTGGVVEGHEETKEKKGGKKSELLACEQNRPFFLYY